MVGGNKGSGRDAAVLVDNGSFEEAFYALNHLRVDYPADCPDRVRTVDDLEVWLHVLHNGGCDHEYILCYFGQLFDDQVDHLAESGLRTRIERIETSQHSTEILLKTATHIFVLKQLCYPEKQGRSLLGPEALADVEEVNDFGKEDPAFARADGRLVEDARLLDDRGLVLEEDPDWALGLDCMLRCRIDREKRRRRCQSILYHSHSAALHCTHRPLRRPSC